MKTVVESKTFSNVALLTLTVVLTIALFIVQGIILVGVQYATGLKLQSIALVVNAIPNIVLARLLARRISKLDNLSPAAVMIEIRGRRYGLSPSTVVEIRGRSLLRDDGMASDRRVVAAYLPRAYLWLCSGFFFIAACAMGCAPLFQPKGTGPAWRWMMIGFCSLFSILFVYTCSEWNQPQAKADWDGVIGYNSIAPWRKFVPWTNIMTCVLLTRCNPFGEPAHYLPVFKGHNGETLLVLNLAGVRVKDQERFVEYIRTKLPMEKPFIPEV